jgi:hypothetical protein
MSILQNALEELKTTLLNKTRLQFSNNEYNTMKESLSFYEENWKADLLWKTTVEIIGLLKVLSSENVNYFANPNNYDDCLEDKKDEAFEKLQSLLRGI